MSSWAAGHKEGVHHGWKLYLGGYSVTVDDSTTAPGFMNAYRTFKDGTRVYVKRPDGGTDGYTFTPIPAQTLFGIPLSWYPAFAPDTGALNDLVVDQAELIKLESTGEYIDYSLGGYNPANPSFGGAYDVVEYRGLTHEIYARTGEQIKIRDRNTNELTFTPDAVISNRGIQVKFERDAQGRIIAAEDPRGNKVRYRYDPRGDLVEVTDRLGIVIAGYAYRTSDPLHHLTTVTDANGTRALEAAYYTGTEQGAQPYFKDRLKEVKDAEGQAATTSYVLTTSERNESVSVPKPGGGTTTTQASYDDWGNPTEVKAALGSLDQAWSTASFTAGVQTQWGLPTETRQVKGQIDPGGGEADDVITTLVYDTKGNATSSTDILGGVTRITYTSKGEPLTISDPLGNATSNSYDTRGNLLRTMSQEGVRSDYEYDTRGLVTKIAQGQAVTQMGYDSVGRMTSQTMPTNVTTNYNYDPNGNQTGSNFVWVNPDNSSDQRSVTTSVTFDANDQAIEDRDARNNISKTSYDRLGRAVKSTDPRGAISETVYDLRGLTVENRNPDGTVTRTAYDALGRSEWVTDAFMPGSPTMGTKNIYDDQGRVLRTERYTDVIIDITTTGGRTRAVLVSSAPTPVSTTTSVYDQLGRVTQSDITGSATTKPFYDRLGRQTRSELWDGTTLLTWSETRYDAAGRALAGKDALNQVTRTEYDGDGRPVGVFYVDNSVTQIEYDSLGRKLADIDQFGRRTEYIYDSQGRLTQVRQPAVPDPLNNNILTVPATSYAHDAYSNHRQTSDARGRITRWTFDQFQQELTRTLPDVSGQPTATETKTYNGYGQLLTHTDFKGHVAKYFYDTDPGRADPQNPSLRLGRLTAVEYYVSASAATPAETVQYRYDAEGRRDKVIDSVAGTTDYHYDAAGRLVRVASPAGLAQTINYGYDTATGQLTRMWTDKTDVSYAYDKLGRLLSVTLTKRDGLTLTNQEQTTYGFDIVGNLTSITQKVGTPIVFTVTLGYDALNRLTSRLNKDGANNTLSSFNYTRLANGQISTLTETVTQPGGGSITSGWYTYDALNRLTREQVDTSGTADDYTIDYTLDLVGNRMKRLTTKGSGAVERVEGTFDARDGLNEEKVYDAAAGGTLTNTITYGYDANGSLITRSATAGGSLTQAWDLRNRLQSATDVQGGTTRQLLNRCDPYNIRVREEVRTTTGGITDTEARLLVLDHQSASGYAQVIEERTEPGVIVASYLYGAGLDPISIARTGQPTGLYLADAHSGVRQIVDLAGAAVLAAYRYNAFGHLLASAGTISNPVLYRGERFDSVLGQYYLRARFYDALTGRFARLDPFLGILEVPLSLHKYAYAHSDPVNGADPSGEFFSTTGLLAGLGIQAQGQSMNQTAQLMGKKLASKFVEEVLDTLNFSEPSDPRNVRMAAAGERLWARRLRGLGYVVVTMQSTVVGRHGPDMIAIKMNGGQVHVMIGEIKAVSSSVVGSALDRMTDNTLQMSLGWLSGHAGFIVGGLVSFLVNLLHVVAPPGLQQAITFVKAALLRGNFDLFLLRARYYGNARWKLRGFRLLNVGQSGIAAVSNPNDVLRDLVEEWPRGTAYERERIS